MRSILLIMILSLLSSVLFAGELGPKLKEALDADGESFDVVITLKNKLNGKKIRRFVKRKLGIRGRKNVRRAVIERLKEQSVRDQAGLRRVLSKLTKEEGRYLWATNSISLELSRDAITEVLAQKKVKKIELNVVQQFLEPDAIKSKKFKRRFGKREIQLGRSNKKRGFKNKRGRKRGKKRRGRRGRRRSQQNQQVSNLAVGDALPDFNSFNTYGLEVTQSDDVNNVLGITGKGVVVAILDTGIQSNHSEFQGTVTDLAGNTRAKFVTGASFIAAEPDAQIDLNNHGTHCAGTAAGKTVGCAPDAQLMAVKVLSATGSGSGIGIIQGIQFATNNGADVISMSLGTASDNPGTDGIENAVNNAVALGAVVVCAAGNAGPNARTVGSPGSSPLVISVGAHDQNGNMANFSSRGPNADGQQIPTLSAPGVSIRSSIANGGFSFFSGTSMATPHVAGISALLLEVLKPAEANGFVLPEDETRTSFLKGILNANVVGEAIPNVTGAGLINAFNAVSALATLTTPEPEPEPEPEPQASDFTEEKLIADTITVLQQVYGSQLRFFRFFLNGAIEINQEERTAVIRLFIQRFVGSFATFSVTLNFTLQNTNPEAPVDEAVFNYIIDEAGRSALENTLP